MNNKFLIFSDWTFGFLEDNLGNDILKIKVIKGIDPMLHSLHYMSKLL